MSLKQDRKYTLEDLQNDLFVQQWRKYYNNLFSKDRQDFRDINYRIQEDDKREIYNTITTY